jgi:hypothetical protein
VLAGLATLAVFLTDNPQYLRVAVVAVAWAFVLATFAAGRRDTDRVAAAAREAELRQAYELELDREVAARREYELDLEHELRREADQSMRYELDALRGDIAALSGLREEVARVSELRGDIAALTSLRDEVARVAALGNDVAALSSLRQDLGQLAELRSEMGRLRAEITEQLSSEMLVERIVMRTQASRLPGEPGRIDGGPSRAVEGSWADDVPPRELTGGWPAIRLDEPRETQQFEEVRIQRSGPRPPVPAAGRQHSGSEPPAPERRPWDRPLPSWETAGGSEWPVVEQPGARYARDEPAGPPPTTMSPIAPSSIARPPVPVPSPPAEPPPSPLDWLAARSLLDASSSLDAPSSPDAAVPTSSRPEVPQFRRRTDDEPRDAARAWASAEARTTQRPAVPSPVRVDDRGAYRVAVREEEPPTAPGSGQDKQLADILAENGVSPSSGGRRRRRYRDEDDADDVLARVLGQG